MKKTELKEVTCCDHCGKETYVTACMGCGIEHCWECRKTEGKEYSHGVNFSGSGDGYYCSKCDAALAKNGDDERHTAYRAVASLRLEAEAWGADFQRRQKAAEARIEALRHNVELTGDAQLYRAASSDRRERG